MRNVVNQVSVLTRMWSIFVGYRRFLRQPATSGWESLTRLALMLAISRTKNPWLKTHRCRGKASQQKEESAEKGEENAIGKSYRDAARSSVERCALHLNQDYLNALNFATTRWSMPILFLRIISNVIGIGTDYSVSLLPARVVSCEILNSTNDQSTFITDFTFLRLASLTTLAHFHCVVNRARNELTQDTRIQQTRRNMQIHERSGGIKKN